MNSTNDDNEPIKEFKTRAMLTCEEREHLKRLQDGHDSEEVIVQQHGLDGSERREKDDSLGVHAYALVRL